MNSMGDKNRVLRSSDTVLAPGPVAVDIAAEDGRKAHGIAQFSRLLPALPRGSDRCRSVCAGYYYYYLAFGLRHEVVAVRYVNIPRPPRRL
ncbi:hypothetical protein V1478_012519 [Vespula squamosa]|uniref:Uncharacterized protein n=1 Tax=Vespula squamosa TaxID=30214 RepID=A0ABD2ADH1_VESSQ